MHAEANAHANRSMRRLCGNHRSIVPGVSRARAHNVHRWLYDVLRADSPDGPASFAGSNVRVVSHSWLCVEGDPRQAIRRTDAVIDRDGLLQVFAAANAWDEFPVMANCHNAVIVGRVADVSSLGPTLLDTRGRCKPDILAPLHSTSQATPCVAAAAVLLAESAILQGKPEGARPQVIKSVLMTGAQKLARNAAFKIERDWHQGADALANDPGSPLDLRQGAGMLRLDRSYAILREPQSQPGKETRSTGWLCGGIAEGKTEICMFTLNEDGEFAATLAWHRHIPSFGNVDSSQLSNLDLCLRAARTNTPGEAIALSISRIDNVQHINVPGLSKGRYALVVTGTEVREVEAYGLSWGARAPGNCGKDGPA